MNDRFEGFSLRRTLAQHADNHTLDSLTVMSGATDPYRLDTPANHRDARWLAEAWARSGARRPIHLRGLHYALVSMDPPLTKPDGSTYVNSHDDWIWLQRIGNIARWLGYIEFAAVTDERNSGPLIYTLEEPRPPWVGLTDNIFMAGPREFERLLPSVDTGWRSDGGEFSCRQAHRLVLIGEKTSLAEVLEPIAHRCQAELILPTGELSTTLLFGIVRRAAADGRPCRIFYFADFDPSGWHMPVEVARKVQALREMKFQTLDIQIRRCALTFEQVRDLTLPGTPLKHTERRADKWRARWGVEQTEIDALATLRPAELRAIAEQALAPYIDARLQARVSQEHRRVMGATSTLLEREIQARGAELERVRALHDQAAEASRLAYEALAPLTSEILAAVEQEIPEIEMPEPKPDGDQDTPLFDSGAEWRAQTERLLRERL